MKKVTLDQEDFNERLNEAFRSHDAQREEDWDRGEVSDSAADYQYLPGTYADQYFQRRNRIIRRLNRAGKVWKLNGWAK